MADMQYHQHHHHHHHISVGPLVDPFRSHANIFVTFLEESSTATFLVTGGAFVYKCIR